MEQQPNIILSLTSLESYKKYANLLDKAYSNTPKGDSSIIVMGIIKLNT